MKLNGWVMLLSSLTLAVSFWNRNELPRDIPLVSGIEQEPSQRRTRAAPFDVNWDDNTYRVEPQYDYELTGLIVSYRHQDGETRMHRLTNDKLNMLDLCVVWGENAGNPLLNRFKFWNGVFTCNWQTRDRSAWQTFDNFQISNNHLISADEGIRDAVHSIRIGDQIRVRGVLANYISPGGAKRGTSITREDTGNGACETIYVSEFEILRRGKSVWRYAMYGSLLLLLLSLARHFFTPHRPY